MGSALTARRRWFGYAASLALVCLSACNGCEGCQQPTPPPLLGAPGAAHSADVDPLGTAVRPLRKYYVDNNNNLCAAYWIAPETRSVRREVKCPRAIEPGERLWLSGRVCFRESADVSRRVPVRCPPAVLRPESQDRVDAGEYVLPQAPEDAGR